MPQTRQLHYGSSDREETAKEKTAAIETQLLWIINKMHQVTQAQPKDDEADAIDACLST